MFKQLVTLFIILGIIASINIMISNNVFGASKHNDKLSDKLAKQEIKKCAYIFDQDLNKLALDICDLSMDYYDEICKNAYHNYCFGRAWINYLSLSEHIKGDQ